MRGSDKRMNSVLDMLLLRCLQDIWVGLFRWQIEHFDLELRRQIRAGEVPGEGVVHEQEVSSQMVNETPQGSHASKREKSGL